MKNANLLHVGGVGLQAADDHADGGGQQVRDVPQHHARRLGPRQDVVHKAQQGLCGRGWEGRRRELGHVYMAKIRAENLKLKFGFSLFYYESAPITL